MINIKVNPNLAGEDERLEKGESKYLAHFPAYLLLPSFVNLSHETFLYLSLIIMLFMPLLLFRRKKKEAKEEKKEEQAGQQPLQKEPKVAEVNEPEKKQEDSPAEPVIKIVKELGPGRTEVEVYKPQTAMVSQDTSNQSIAVQQDDPKLIRQYAKKDYTDPADWILDCVGGYDFWPEENGPIPKSELEKEFKKKFPNVTLANFNSIVYDLIYKDKLISEIVDGATLLRLSADTKAEKAAEWNKRYAEARLLIAQMKAQKPGMQTGARRKEWIEISPQAELGKGGPWDELNKQMSDMKWYGRVMSSDPKEIKGLMWHREPPLNERQPPKNYYPNIMLEWRQSTAGQAPYWHIEGVNITEQEFLRMMQDKTWKDWLAKNKISIDVQTWEEAVLKVLEMARSFV